MLTEEPLASLSNSLLLGSSSLLGLSSAELSSLEDRGRGELNVLFRADSNEVAGNVNELFADGNVSLSDQYSSVMDRVAELSLGNDGLESSLKHLVNGETEHVIELSLIFLEETESNHSSDKSITYL